MRVNVICEDPILVLQEEYRSCKGVNDILDLSMPAGQEDEVLNIYKIGPNRIFLCFGSESRNIDFRGLVWNKVYSAPNPGTLTLA